MIFNRIFVKKKFKNHTMEMIKKKKAFGTFDHEPVLDLQKRMMISATLNKIMAFKKLDGATIALASTLHKVTVSRVKNLTKPYTQTVFDKLLKGLQMTEKEFFKF